MSYKFFKQNMRIFIKAGKGLNSNIKRCHWTTISNITDSFPLRLDFITKRFSSLVENNARSRLLNAPFYFCRLPPRQSLKRQDPGMAALGHGFLSLES